MGRGERVPEPRRERTSAQRRGLDGVGGDVGVAEADQVTVQACGREFGRGEPIVREVQER